LLIDGQATEVFGLKEYRSNIGAVFADDVLFSGTIAENLALFDPDISMRRIEEALDTVGLLDDVYRLPQGMATLVSQEGALLSTGQRRRLLLARALCRRPRLLLLDEVTANLDMPMEDRMMRSLRALPGAKIFATHSERVLTHMDRVFEIRDGAFLERKFSESAERPPTTADA
jgi:ATP-binding cassette subfamily B protein RaxB